MSKTSFRFELNRAGVRELLKGAEMRSAIASEAAGIAARAGEGYASDVKTASTRVYANVYPASKEAAHDNYENNTLEKVIRS